MVNERPWNYHKHPWKAFAQRITSSLIDIYTKKTLIISEM